MWSIAKEGQPLLASSSLSKLGHKEPVAKVNEYLCFHSHDSKHLIPVPRWNGSWTRMTGKGTTTCSVLAQTVVCWCGGGNGEGGGGCRW